MLCEEMYRSRLAHGEMTDDAGSVVNKVDSRASVTRSMTPQEKAVCAVWATIYRTKRSDNKRHGEQIIIIHHQRLTFAVH